MIKLLKNWPKGEPVPALSLRQPWATAVALYGKDVENRSRIFKYRGPLIIHASATKPHIDNFNLFLEYAKLDGVPASELRVMKKVLDEGFCPGWFKQGCLLAVVNLSDAFDKDAEPPEDHPALESPWAEDGYGWLYLTEPQPIVPVAYKGAVGMFKVPYKIAASLAPLKKGWNGEVLPLQHEVSGDFFIEKLLEAGEGFSDLLWLPKVRDRVCH